MSQQVVNPLSKPSKSMNQANKLIIKVEQPKVQQVQQPETCGSIFTWTFIIIVLATFLVFIPLIETALGIKYMNTSSCLSHGIHGIQVLFVKGLFGLIYMILFVVENAKNTVDLEKTFWKNIKKFSFWFLIVTILYAAIHVLLMILEFIFLNKCSDYVSNVSAILWISALNTIFAILYIVYTVLRAILC